MNKELKLEEFLRTIPDKITRILSGIDDNTELLNKLKLTMKEFENRLSKIENRTSFTELNSMIIN